MSQIYKIVDATAGGGDVLFLAGNTGGNVGPTGLGVINVVGDTTTINVAGNAGTNTLTISAAGSQVDTVQTVGAVTATLATIPITDDTVVFIESKVIGAYEAAINWAFGISLMTTTRKQGAAAPVIVEGVIQENARARTLGTNPVVNATYIVSGNNIIIQVTGEGGSTINWKSVTTVLRQAVP